MKRIMAFILVFILITSLFPAIPASAVGDSNIDTGGGGMGTGSSTSYWNGGDDGVRVTVITKEGTQVTTPFDFSNNNRSNVGWHFGRVSKISYVGGAALSLQGGTYDSYIPGQTMPRIISTSANKANIGAIKNFFCSEYVVKRVAEITGMDYDTLIGGDYKLLLEPIAYFHFKGLFFAMTATEAALYNKSCNGALRASMVSLTSKNLPLAMFLDVADLGFPAYAGATGVAQSDDTIISQLGLGAVSFKKEAEVSEVEVNYEYRTDTDVITSITLSNKGSDDITPDDDCKVAFDILGTTYKTEFVCPARSKQLVWIKWHTPSLPQLVYIKVRGEGFDISSTITANIIQLTENPPPDPQYGDANNRFKLADIPDYGSRTSASWSQWVAKWVESVDEDNLGHWEFKNENYTASLNVDFTIRPDDRVKTGALNNGIWTMKSGYGIDADCETSVYTSGSPSFSTDYTQAQNEISTFSDFGFETYNRFLEPEDSRSRSTDWHFKKNINSYYDCRVHFTPLWYPDGTKYLVALSVLDVWTPVGMLCATTRDYVLINGTVYDDWYIRLTK